MNQHALLQCIRRHVRESITDDGTARPLGEVVGRVFAEINTASPPTVENTNIIPIPFVAAFVDGTLSDAEAETVCQAAIQNRSVVAELVAAVRGQQEARQLPPPLSPELSDRLLEMGKSLSPGSAVPSSESRPAGTPQENTATVSPPSPVSIQVTPTVAASSRGAGWKWMGALAAVAATVLLLVYWQYRPPVDPSPKSKQVVKTPGLVPEIRRDQDHLDPDRIDPDRIDPDRIDPDRNDPAPDAPSVESERIVEMPQTEVPQPETLPNQEAPDQDQRTGPTTPPKVAAEDSPKAGDRPSDDTMFAPESVAPSRNGPQPTVFAELKWKRIHGILAAEQTIPIRSDVSATRTSVRWKSVGEDTVSFEDVLQKRDVSLRTLSFSRAEAELASGGRLVLRGETAADLTTTSDASVELDLLHGGIAMIDFPVDTIINLRSQNRAVGRIHWSQPRSTVLAEYGREGLIIHVEGSGVTIDDRELERPTVVVGDNQDLQPVPSLKRLPAWVDRNVDSIEIPRTVLAQISGTNDLMQSLSTRIGDLAMKPSLSNEERKTLVVLARWQVTLGEGNLFRLLSNKFAVVRLIALERLVDLPEWEPRYDMIWGPIRRNSKDQRQAARMERLCKMVRSSQQLNNQQIDQMISGLDSPGLATRAMYDYLLRRIFGDGPNFDPTIKTSAGRATAIGHWRRFAAMHQQ